MANLLTQTVLLKSKEKPGKRMDSQPEESEMNEVRSKSANLLKPRATKAPLRDSHV